MEVYLKYLRKILFNRVFMIGTSIFVQLLFLLAMLAFLKDYSQLFYGTGILISILATLWIVYNDSNPAYKIAWIIPITLMPIFGGLFYLSFGGNQLSKKEKAKMKRIEEVTKKELKPNEHIIKLLESENCYIAQQARYIQTYGPYPIYRSKHVEYFSSGEENFLRLKEALLKAEKYIFMEYFIIEEGIMWHQILSILESKVKKGVDVRIIFDDLGCMLKLPEKYEKTLLNKGIKCSVFNPLIPIISSKFNTRDHRKMTVIDGTTAFTGGINLADEYINEVNKFGHWKDMGIMLQGNSVWSFTVMFLSLWDYLNSTESDFNKFRVHQESTESIGYVQPYSDNPLDDENVGENVYLNMINKAKKYVYITTPYLIIDSDMVTALCNAGKNGVDVKIITPGIPDKWYVHHASRSYYEKLYNSGVKILEYTPGFMHGKNFVSDDVVAIVGTINMDFRSLYLHFECGVWMYKTPIVKEIRDDFIETQGKCRLVEKDDFRNIGVFKIMLGLILRLFAPLM